MNNNIINFNIIDDSEELQLQLVDDNDEINFSMTDYDDTEIKNEINNLETQINTNTADISDLNDRVDEIPIVTKTSQLTNDSGFITSAYHDNTKQDKLVSGQNIKTINNQSVLGSGNIQIEGVTNYPELNNLPQVNGVTLTGNKTSSDLGLQPAGNYATRQELTNEATARENADIGLQNQIDAITSSSDVKDVVGTYNDLLNYPTSTLGNNDIVKVLQDSTHDDAMSYYRWVITAGVGAWVYIGSEAPYYTKGETDTLLNAKQNAITSNNMLESDLVDDTNQTNQFVTTTEKTAWNSKVDPETIVEITPVDGVVNLGTTSASNIYYINSPIHSLTAIVNNGENEHTRIIFTADNQITKENPFTLSLTNTNNNLYFDNGALPKPVTNETWVFDIVKNRCIATMYKENYMGWDRDEQILFLIRSNSDQIYYPSLDSKPSITMQSARGSTDVGRPVVMEYSEPVLTSYQNVEYYGIPQFIPLDLSIYDTSTQANQLHPHSQLPDGNYWVKSPGKMWVAGESYQLVGKELIYKKGDVLSINGGEYTAAYYAWDSTENDYKGGFFTTYQDVTDAISEINYEPGLTIVRQTTATGTTTVNNGRWNKRVNPVNSMTLATANLTEIPDTFKARVTVQTSATFTSFNISQRTAFKVYFAGWDCTNGVLAGKPNAFYNIDYRADGRGNIVAMVTGYDVPTT